MIKLKEIYDFLDSEISFKNQCEWDNSGLITGDKEKEVKTVAVMLDADNETIKEAIRKNADLIISHHPVIFNAIKKINTDDPVYSLIKNDIALIAAHTPWDMAQDGVNFVLANTLSLQNIKAFSTDEGGDMIKIGNLSAEMSEKEFCTFVKQKIGINTVKYISANSSIKTVAVCGGAGADFTPELAGVCDAFVTSDVKYHQFCEAKRLGITLIDAGHYNTEVLSLAALKDKISKRFNTLNVFVIKTSDPISYIN